MNEVFVWPPTQCLKRVLARVGMTVCPDCGCVAPNANALHVHRIFRCRKRIHAGS